MRIIHIRFSTITHCKSTTHSQPMKLINRTCEYLFANLPRPFHKQNAAAKLSTFHPHAICLGEYNHNNVTVRWKSRKILFFIKEIYQCERIVSPKRQNYLVSPVAFLYLIKIFQ